MNTLILCSHLCVNILTSSEEVAARRWFLDWAERRTPPGIEARFTSRFKEWKTGSPIMVQGTWKARFSPYWAFTLEVKRYSGDRVLSEQSTSWDDLNGEGRSHDRQAKQVTGTGMATSLEPSTAGDINYPVTYEFYTVDRRPL